MSFVPKLFYSQLFVTPPVPTADCTGKTIIVTGANTGLGKEAARHFLRLNAEKVIIACRSLDKGRSAKEEIEQSTGRNGVVDVWQLDLSNYDSVKQFAQRAKSLKRLDSVVENAGIATETFTMMEDNESTITVNVVSTFLLALLILPKLQESADLFNITPNLTIISSEVHAAAAFKERKSTNIFQTLNNEKTANMGDRYYTSKLLEVFACREIARLHPISDLKVTLNFPNPGWCHSELYRDSDNAAMNMALKAVGRATEVGSRTLVHAATAGPETHGKYLSDCKVASCSPSVECHKGPETQRRVWAELSEKLERIQPGILKNLGWVDGIMAQN